MPRGPIFQDDYKHNLSGHETFPMRYGWLKKAYDAVREKHGEPGNRAIFLDDDAIARFGVGKNMVSSMRHWATVVGVIQDGDDASTLLTTNIGDMLFGPDGVDPYMEHPASLWLVHWQLAGRPEKTTWFWAFSNYSGNSFERDRLAKGLEKVAKDRAWARVAQATIRRDVECFVRTYVARRATGQASHEDTLESPLGELGLIKPIGRRDGFRFVRGSKSTLGDGVFLYALTDFWARFSPAAQTLSFEAVAHEPGSPGRVFLLDENDIADRLMRLDDFTKGALRWSETAGLKQVLRSKEFGPDDALRLVSQDFRTGIVREAA